MLLTIQEITLTVKDYYII